LFDEWKKEWNAGNSHPLFTGKNRRLDLVLWNLTTKEEREFVQMGTPLKVRLSWIVWGYPGLSEIRFYEIF
jgi:hypothetical protein